MAGRGTADANDGFPTVQLLVLGICRTAEPVAFTSVLAYSYIMVRDFQGGEEKGASFYSGLLVSAFAVAEVCTVMFWGTLSDKVGRKPVILMGLAGTAISGMLFGFAKNYWVALAARVVGGALNGNVAVIQTMVAEMCKKPEYEPRAYTVMPFCWSLGSIAGAALGGYLAQPSKSYPNLFSPDGLFGRYPYLLPNLVSTILIVLAIAQAVLFLKETNPKFQSKPDDHPGEPDETTPLQRARSRRMSCLDDLTVGPRRPSIASGTMPGPVESSFNIRRTSVCTIAEIRPKVIQEETETLSSEPETGPFTRDVLLWTLQLTLMSFHQMAFTTLFPIFIVDDKPDIQGIDLQHGLGLTLHDVGNYMSFSGFVSLIIQGLIFPVYVAKLGVWKALISTTILCPLAYILPPFLTILDGGALAAGIYCIFIVQNFCLIIIFPCLLIELKNSTPSPMLLGKVNGLAMSACCGARVFSPPLAGIIYGAGGSAAGWWAIGASAVLAVVEFYWIERPHSIEDLEVEGTMTKKMSIAN